MTALKNILLIRHLPSVLSNEEKKDLLKHFGAKDVHITGTKGALKEAAFATFDDSDTCSKALSRLHQLEILGSRLVVEYAKTTPETKLHPPSLNIEKKTKKEDKKDEVEEKSIQFEPPQDEVYAKWGLNYPRNPRFRYVYPSPTVTILTNIANALAACPKFYTQVLHLMNKMNLPAPFAQPTPTPPVPSGEIKESSSESEIESDTEITTKAAKKKKRQLKEKKDRPKKRMKLIDDFPTLATAPVEPSKVFELDDQATAQRKIQLNLPSVIPETVENRTKPSIEKETRKEQIVEGFGIIEPVAKPVTSEDNENDDDNCSEFISSEELRRGRISKEERREINVFRKYERGEPSCRLYIKNLAKQTTDKDLKYIYGRYIDWTNSTQVNIFDVRVMKEGRMKGQAFVTLPSEDVAISAVNETHAFILNDKPMLVQFARSAKAIADPKTEDK
ncbi:hypothetical protein SNE40_006556 [Patella caerulea]|uniref:RNA-binding region-containing protein 3 n=1 Tax=Patella caerulea TaxID=87958 RepID=A0AAN8JS50_PATCE